jgi:DNA-binding NtrC family response regulator
MTEPVRKPSILLVEDDGTQRREVSRELAERGLYTVEVDDPASAMEALTNSPNGFSLLVTDLDVLPIGGLSFARVVQRRWPAMPVAIVSCSATGMRVLTPGVTLMARPMVPGQLAEAIARMLSPGHSPEMLAVLSESGFSFKPLRMRAS